MSSLAAAGPSWNGEPLREDTEPNPVSDYGRSKLEAEQAVRCSPLANNAVIVRPPVVYGPRDTDVLQVLRMVSRGLVFQIGRGDRYFSFVYVDDLVEGLIAAAWSQTAVGQTYYIANPEPVTWADFAQEAGQMMGRTVRTIAAPALLAELAGRVCGQVARIRGKPGIISRDKIREARHPYWVCDPSRAVRDFGFEPRTTLREGLSATLAWYRKAGWLRF
jgi:nucleoside-diphosphate-sugar epimerase